VRVLSAQQAKWLLHPEKLLLDPDIHWFSGRQYPSGKENFDVIMVSMPDTWGRTLMRRKANRKISYQFSLFTFIVHTVVKQNYIVFTNLSGAEGH